MKEKFAEYYEKYVTNEILLGVNNEKILAEKVSTAASRAFCTDNPKYAEPTSHGLYCIGAWLKAKGLRRVVIGCKPVQLYGMGFQFGTLDKLLISELEASDEVEVVGLITQTLTTLGNIPILSIANVKADSSIDAIIVAEPEIYQSALHHFGERVIFLNEVIRDIRDCR